MFQVLPLALVHSTVWFYYISGNCTSMTDLCYPGKSRSSWPPHLQTTVEIYWILNKWWFGLSVDPHRLLFSFLLELALIAQGLYTPASLLVRRIRLDLWCFHQDYHSHYTTLYSHVRTKDSCRIRRMPPPALSLLTILLLHLGRSIRLHLTEA